MAKRQRVRLVMADDYEVKDMKDFKEHFEQEKALGYYKKGELLKWLRERYYDDEADVLEQLNENSSDFLKKFCEIFGVEPNESVDYVAQMSAHQAGSQVLSDVTLGNELFQKGDKAWSQNNYSDALQYFQRAADLGNVNAMMAIGYAYLTGSGVAQSNQESLSWFHKAVDLGSHDAMAAIGMLFEQGQLVDGKPDYSEALNWYTKAASAGNAMAMFLVGKMYDEGRGFDKDYNKAGEWYEKAAAAGSEKAVQELKQRKKNMIAACVFLAVVALVIAGIIYWFISS